MTSFGLCRQRGAHRIARPENRREGEKCADQDVAGADSAGVTPDLHAVGKPERLADSRCRSR